MHCLRLGSGVTSFLVTALRGRLLRLQQALIVQLVLRVNWWRVLEGVEESLALLEMT